MSMRRSPLSRFFFKACLYWPMASHMHDEGIGEEMWVGSMDCNRKKIIACDALPAISVNG